MGGGAEEVVVDACATGTSSPPSCRARFGGGHVFGERLLVVVVLVRSRWEGVEGVQNVSAVGGTGCQMWRHARIWVVYGTGLGNRLVFGRYLRWSLRYRSRRAYV